MASFAPPVDMVILNETVNWSAYSYHWFCVIGYETYDSYAYMYVHHEYSKIVQSIPIIIQFF